MHYLREILFILLYSYLSMLKVSVILPPSDAANEVLQAYKIVKGVDINQYYHDRICSFVVIFFTTMFIHEDEIIQRISTQIKKGRRQYRR